MCLIFFTYTSQKPLVVFSDCEARKQDILRVFHSSTVQTKLAKSFLS